MKPTIPSDSKEREFLEFWSEHLLDARDPQNQRWLELELGQIERGRRITREVERFVPLKGARVLDLGSQTGATTIALHEAGAVVTGIDVSEDLARAATIRARCHGAEIEFKTGFAEALPFDSETFDVITFVDVIEHVNDARRAISEIARVLRPGGRVYLFGPNRWSLRWFISDPHYKMFGISVLPPSLGRFYVTRVRRRPRYDVGTFPVGSKVVRWFQEEGLEIDYPVTNGQLISAAKTKFGLRFGNLFTIVAGKPARPL